MGLATASQKNYNSFGRLHTKRASPQLEPAVPDAVGNLAAAATSDCEEFAGSLSQTLRVGESAHPVQLCHSPPVRELIQLRDSSPKAIA